MTIYTGLLFILSLFNDAKRNLERRCNYIFFFIAIVKRLVYIYISMLIEIDNIIDRVYACLEKVKIYYNIVIC